MTLVEYKEIKKEMIKLVSDPKKNAAELVTLSEKLENTRDFLDDFDMEDLIDKSKDSNLTDEELHQVISIISEKKVYEENKEEISKLIEGNYDVLEAERAKKNNKKLAAVVGGLTLLLVGGVAYVGFKYGNKKDTESKDNTSVSTTVTTETLTEGTTVSTEGTTTSAEKITENTEKVTEKEKEQVTEKEKYDIGFIKIQDYEKTKETKEVANNQGTNNQTKVVTDDKKDTNTTSKNDKKDNKKTDNKKDNNTTGTKTDANKTDDNYKDIEPSTEVIDNLNDNKDDVVTINPSTDPKPSLDNVDDTPVGDNKPVNNNNTNDNKPTPDVNNQDLPSIDNVDGNDEITYDVEGKTTGKKLVLTSRGI